MGAAWCRERAEQAHDSKSPLDRVIVKCVNQMSPAERPIPVAVVQQVQGPPKYPRLHIAASKESSASEWQDVALKVPEGEGGPAPIPPPRKKRPRKKRPSAAPEPKKAPAAPAIYLEVDTPTAQHRKASPVVFKEEDLLRLPRRSKSSMSLRSASPVSEATTERLDNYMKSCRSFGSLRPEELIDEINQALSDSSEDSWGGLDDWDLGFVEHFDTAGGSPPLTPTSQLDKHNSPTRGHNRAEFVVGEPRREKKKKRRSSKESVKRRLRKPGGEKGAEDVLAPPANFQTDPKSHIHSQKGASSLIKPSQISVQDFLRQSNDKNKTSVGLPELKLDVPGDHSSFSFDFSKGLMPPRSPQIEIPGTPNTPRGLSRCSSPLPAMFHARTPSSSPTHEEEAATSNLMRILQEYHCTADMIGDRDAKKILEELGIPENLLAEVPEIHKPQENGGSALSSMTPSLTELEASLSELLEASAVGHDDDDEFEEELQHRAPTTDQVKEVRPVIAQQIPTIVSSKPEDDELSTPRKLEEVKEVKPKKDTPLDVVIAQQIPTIVSSKPEDNVLTETSLHKSNIGDDKLPMPRIQLEEVKEIKPKKDTPLDAVIAQQTPKIISSKHEDIVLTDTSLSRDGLKMPAVEEAKRSSVITPLEVA